jgi:hypothetical protein
LLATAFVSNVFPGSPLLLFAVGFEITHTVQDSSQRLPYFAIIAIVLLPASIAFAIEPWTASWHA